MRRGDNYKSTGDPKQTTATYKEQPSPHFASQEVGHIGGAWNANEGEMPNNGTALAKLRSQLRYFRTVLGKRGQSALPPYWGTFNPPETTCHWSDVRAASAGRVQVVAGAAAERVTPCHPSLQSEPGVSWNTASRNRRCK